MENRISNSFKGILLPALLCIICSCIVSCKKDDIGNPKEFYAYTAPGTIAYNVIPGGSITVIGNVIPATTNISFPVLLSRPFDKDVEITAVVDTGWVKNYDSAYSPTKASPHLPANSFALANKGMITIKAGQTVSADSMSVMLADVSKLKAGTNTYIVPVVLTAVSNDLPVSNTRQVMYIKYEITSIVTSISGTAGLPVINVTLKNSNGVNSGTNKAYIISTLNKSIEKDLSVKVKNDDALVDKFNKANGTSYKTFPTGSFKLTTDNVTIPANNTLSKDSIEITFPNLDLFVSGLEYLLPVQMIDDSDPSNPRSDPSKNIVYIYMSVFENNINSSNTDLTGTVIDRTNWKVTTSGYYSVYSGDNVLDGSNSTVWDSNPGLPVWLQLDMGTKKTVKGFSLVPNYMFTSDDFLNMDVYSSKDALIWKLEGQYEGTFATGSPNSPDIKTVKFITPVTAQYFKFSITNSTNGSYGGMAELNATE